MESDTPFTVTCTYGFGLACAMNADTFKFGNFQSEEKRSVSSFSYTFPVFEIMLPLARIFDRTDSKIPLWSFHVTGFHLVSVVFSNGYWTLEDGVTILNDRQL